MLRVRNEELLILDTLNHLSTFVDGVVIYDDASVDQTVKIALDHPLVLEVIVNKRWRSYDRIWEETANRRLLLKRAEQFNPEWVFYSDADERFEGDIRNVLLNKCGKEIVGVKVQLLDAYLTAEDCLPYKQNQKLFNFRKNFGPERRDILMAWRPSRNIEYFLPDSREPTIQSGQLSTQFWCQHYGKAISIAEWESTCDYYIANFPEIYRERWSQRKGKAIHSETDFGAELLSWERAKKLSYPLVS